MYLSNKTDNLFSLRMMPKQNCLVKVKRLIYPVVISFDYSSTYK